jgi:hypothetical protein
MLTYYLCSAFVQNFAFHQCFYRKDIACLTQKPATQAPATNPPQTQPPAATPKPQAGHHGGSSGGLWCICSRCLSCRFLCHMWCFRDISCWGLSCRLFCDLGCLWCICCRAVPVAHRGKGIHQA